MLDPTLNITEADIPGHIPHYVDSELKDVPQAHHVHDPAIEIESRVATRPAEARSIKVTDQATLDAVGERLVINKAFQKEADGIFDPVIAAALASHRAALAGKRKVTDPLMQEEAILKSAAQGYIIEQRRIAEELERAARIAREAEERRLLAEAEERRKVEEARINAMIAEEDMLERERVLNSLPMDTPREIMDAICDAPAPEPVHVPLDIPVMAPAVRVAPTINLPKGMSMARRYKAEVTSITQLCRAVAEGKVPSTYVTANMAALNARAEADRAALSVPGVRAIEDFSISQRSAK